MAMLEARPYRPFKSSEEYLEAMKEDLAEWLSTLYPDLLINAENFMDRLDTGVALCKHANYVREAAEDYLARRQARNKSMTRSMTSGLAGPILAMGTVHYLPAAKSGTFFSRDNVSNFITWCRKSLKIIECLLFETDDLIMRKNEKHVILCLLEVARRGAKFGMLAPMLVQMERQIDREIAADQKANATQTDNSATQTEIGVGTESVATETNIFDDSDSENDNDVDDEPVLMYGPQPQIITNDLKSLDEMVRDLVEKCTCPSQFPMVRVSEGKYRIGDTKVLIFVRILRSHVMVRVGGGWDTLSHYLDKHDPCRCKAQHRPSMAARVVPRTSNQGNGIDLNRAQVIYERSPPAVRKFLSNFSHQSTANPQPSSAHPHSSHSVSPSGAYNNNSLNSNSSPTSYASPTPQRKFLNHHQQQQSTSSSSSSSDNGGDKLQPPPATTTNGGGNVFTSPNLARRSMSPSPKRLIDMRKKQNSLESYKSMPLNGDIDNGLESGAPNGSGSTDTSANNSNKFENISDNGSEISDEGYRSLGVIQLNAQKRESLHSQASNEDAESNARLDHTSSESPLSPIDDATLSAKTPDLLKADLACDSLDGCGPQSLPAILSASPDLMLGNNNLANNKFEQSGVYITDDEITVDISSALPNIIYTDHVESTPKESRIRAPTAKGLVVSNERKAASVNTLQKGSSASASQRRRSIDNSTCGGSLQDLHSRTGLPVFTRSKPVYRSVRKPVDSQPPTNVGSGRKSAIPPTVRDVTNTWSGRSVVTTGRKRPTINADTFQPNRPASTTPAAGTNGGGSPFERNTRQRSSQITYDSNGRRIKGCTASLTTSPVKNYATSPLAQQLLEAASSAKNDAQILEKMKTLLSRYSTGKQPVASSAGAKGAVKKPPYDDFTTAWVHSNGNLERSNSCSPPTKTLSKRSSAASSIESNPSRDMSALLVAPRRERGMSKIPAPVRQNTELY